MTDLPLPVRVRTLRTPAFSLTALTFASRVESHLTAQGTLMVTADGVTGTEINFDQQEGWTAFTQDGKDSVFIAGLSVRPCHALRTVPVTQQSGVKTPSLRAYQPHVTAAGRTLPLPGDLRGLWVQLSGAQHTTPALLDTPGRGAALLGETGPAADLLMPGDGRVLRLTGRWDDQVQELLLLPVEVLTHLDAVTVDVTGGTWPPDMQA